MKSNEPLKKRYEAVRARVVTAAVRSGPPACRALAGQVGAVPDESPVWKMRGRGQRADIAPKAAQCDAVAAVVFRREVGVDRCAGQMGQLALVKPPARWSRQCDVRHRGIVTGQTATVGRQRPKVGDADACGPPVTLFCTNSSVPDSAAMP